MMTDRLYHSGAYKTLKYSATDTNYFYYFAAKTLNALPNDPLWRDSTLVDMENYKDLGVAPGDDVSKFKMNAGGFLEKKEILARFNLF
jgi:hypothetical protein